MNTRTTIGGFCLAMAATLPSLPSSAADEATSTATTALAQSSNKGPFLSLAAFKAEQHAKTFAQYLSNRVFRFLHHFSGVDHYCVGEALVK